jgi:hypothetical protein
MMRPFTPAGLRLPLAGLALVVAALSFGCCDCDELETVKSIEHVGTIAKVEKIEVVGTPEPTADHWIVIHDKVEAVTDEAGNSIGCEPAGPSDDAAFLPECLHAKLSDTVGIVNCSKTAVEVNHFSTLAAPNPIVLASGERDYFPMAKDGQSVLWEIKRVGGLPPDHGGPEMIVQP